ncbi:Zinc finger CCHC domain-containing protein 8 [Senna tora]|uniref:Zinc finger CCHC domain-containing protein 8 n=1 Tax=Senna tora TaxID=362788 RepID=A0A834TDN4_9FABA|nr:Zinc finger CCHC domain-containing protein 8 [Senna tora]
MDDGDLNGLPSTSDSGSGSEKSKTQYGCSGIDSQHTSSGHKQDRLNGENLAKDYVENHSLMETEDNVIGSINTGCRDENNEKCVSACTQPSHILDEKDKMENEKVCTTKDCIQIQDAHCMKETNLGKGLVDSQSTLQVNFELTETVVAPEEQKCENSGVISENGCQTFGDECPNRSHSRSTSLGVKRSRISVDEHQPSVHVVYNSLTKASKEKLEGLLKQWSEWHAQHVCLSKDPSEVLEYGEDTFFPALHIGLEKTSAVSFWMDNQITKEQNKGFTPLDGNSVPLYDRGYALGLTSADGSSNVEGGPEIVDPAARCFNCGSYTHSLRECPRPRDNAAVNIARKQHKSKRNQNASRNPTRYYQDPPAGKYDGLRPGVLDAETRQLLGLGELDPPPWLNRMRDLGYPPGYLDVDEDQPSGITIYGDEEIREQEDGEILEADYPKSKRKMTVEFPGINAPIPENADERLWTAASSSSDISRNRPQHRSNYSSTDYGSRGYYRDRRSSADFVDDGPPGDPGHSSSKYSFHPRYGGYDNDYSPQSPSWGRSLSDRSWRSPLYDEGPVNPSSFSFHYSAMERLVSPRDPDSGRPNNSWTESQYDRDLGRSSRTKDYSEGRHHRSWR